MPTKIKSTTIDQRPGAGEVVQLTDSTQSLAKQIEQDVALVPTPKLVPFYLTAKRVTERIVALQKKVKEELLKPDRLKEAAIWGIENQHKEYRIGEYSLKVQETKRWPLNIERAKKFVNEKNLGDDVNDLVIESGGPELQQFLRKHRKEVAQMGLRIREELNPDKLAALVTLKKITTDEFEQLLDKKEPTYTFKEGK
jgi:hypothetical protein